MKRGQVLTLPQAPEDGRDHRADLRAQLRAEFSRTRDAWLAHHVASDVAASLVKRGYTLDIPLSPPPVCAGPGRDACHPRWPQQWVDRLVAASLERGEVRDVLVELFDECGVGCAWRLVDAVLAAVGGGASHLDAAAVAREIMAAEAADAPESLTLWVAVATATLSLIVNHAS